MAQKGNISIHAENLLPIIKKWLYSDKDIFIRELAANGCDAITKLRALGAGEGEDLRVTVTVDKEHGTITFSDNGVGMTSGEIDRYINQVAFSGAQEFIDKLQQSGASADSIIGHFGLGFYSAFMVSDKVVINSKSYLEGEPSAMWSSDGGLEYEMGEGTRQEHGTDVVLHIAEDAKEYLEDGRVGSVAARYLSFMPVPIYMAGAEQSVNDTEPLYLKKPSDVTDEEYIAFYKKTFGAWDEPLFWVHLNIDYPFNLKGILYFPRIDRSYGINDGCVKLYCRQVFVAENIKEIIPDYLLLLKGVIDSPDIPLNVSRSFLQSDSQVRRLSSHISRKAADRLVSLFSTERERFEKVWDDVNMFVKYGCMRDDKFFEQVKGCIIFRTVESNVLTLEEAAEKQKEQGGQLFYAGEEQKNAPVVDMFTAAGVDVLLLDQPIDAHFVQFLEYKLPELKLKRVDSGLAEGMSEGGADEQARAELEGIMRAAVGDEHLEVKLEKLKDAQLPAVLTYDEQMLRFRQTSRLYGETAAAMPIPGTLTLNSENDLIKALPAMEGERQTDTARHIYDLAELAVGELDRTRMAEFIRRAYKLL